MAKFLLSLNVAVDGSNNRFPLRAAIARDHYTIFKQLLEEGASPNRALEQAIINKDVRYLMLLLAYGADATYVSILGVLHATTYAHIKLLLAFGATFLLREFSGDLCRIYGDSCVWLLISAGISVPEQYYDRFVRPPLYETAKTQFRLAKIRKEVRKLRS